MRNQRGITLIALVITIIVLLILAGVSIAMLTGENGILNKATSSRTATNKAEAVERINLALNAVKTEIYDQQSREGQANWEPITGTSTYTLESEITTALGLDGFDTEYNTSTPIQSNTYSYSFDISTGVLTLAYYNTTTEVGTQASPISGSIDLKASSNYEIDKAE